MLDSRLLVWHSQPTLSAPWRKRKLCHRDVKCLAQATPLSASPIQGSLLRPRQSHSDLVQRDIVSSEPSLVNIYINYICMSGVGGASNLTIILWKSGRLNPCSAYWCHE